MPDEPCGARGAVGVHQISKPLSSGTLCSVRRGLGNCRSRSGRFQLPLLAVVMSTLTAVSAAANDGFFDIGGGRRMYLECRGSGSPTVVLISGLKASADDWNTAAKPGPAVFSGVANLTRVCAYDRPGTPVGEQASRSDPVRQPTTGLIARLYARLYPEAVTGLVLVHALSEWLQEAETPNQWAVQRVVMEGDIRESLRLYPDLERIDPDRSFDEIRAASPLKPIPLVVLSADRP